MHKLSHELPKDLRFMKSSENLEMPRVPVGIIKGQFLASQQKQNILTTASKN